MNELVFMRHNEPMTNSLAIAAGTENEHDSVILLIRKFLDELETFGKIGFEVAPEGNSRFEIGNSVVEVKNPRDSKGRRTEFAFLNEPQATLLITFMRNSEIVVRFKVELVRAFYGMRDRLAVPRDMPLSATHRADILVSADRTFRAALRSGRSAGLRMTQALRRANEIALQNTGINMLAALQAEEIAVEPAAPIKRDYGIPSFLAEWRDGRLPVPHCICRSSVFYDAYVMWCGENDANPARITQFAGLAQRADPSLEKFITGIPVDGGGMHSVRVIVPHGARAGQEAGEWTRHVASECARFAAALAEWKDAA